MTIRSVFTWIAVGAVTMAPAFVAAQTAPAANAAPALPSAAPAPPAAAPAPPTAEAFYRRALAQTRQHASPGFATYAAKVDGIDCSVRPAEGVACNLKLSGHSTTKEPLQVAYRSADDRVAVEEHGRSYAFDAGPFLNATWRGVDELIRWGFVGKPAPAQQPAQALQPATAPQPAATIDPQSNLPVIAVVSSLSPDAYRVEDFGAARCSNGDPGHMVLLTAKRDPLRYPVSAAVVNMRTGDLCMVRFGARVYGVAGLVGATGDAELDLAQVNGYEMVQDEHVAINLRAAGIAVKRLDFDIAFSNYGFPQAISPVVFATPVPSAQPSPRTIVSP